VTFRGAGDPVPCHTRATRWCLEVFKGACRDGVGEGGLPVLGGVQIDERGAAAGVTHALHQLAEVSAGLGEEVVAGVAEVVEVDAGEAGGGERLRPGTTPEVAVPEQFAAR
jgi:hypothetical protein